MWSDKKRIEKLRHVHRNPVKRGLVMEPEQWKWSSFRLLERRARPRAGELPGVATGDQSLSGGEVWGQQQHTAPTHSQSTRMNGAPG